MKRKGMTLMELLFVTSILATLAALLFPVYLRVRSKTDALICAEQLKQIGLALRMYVHEQGDDTPYSMPQNLGLLYPHYVRSKDLLVCPYFQKLAPEVVEDMHQIAQTYWQLPWYSYFDIQPRALDRAAQRDLQQGRFSVWVSFSEVFAKRGDQTPIAYCDAHQSGCPHSPITISYSLKSRSLPCRSWSNPNAPIVVLRWGGSIHLVQKGGREIDTLVFLMTY